MSRAAHYYFAFLSFLLYFFIYFSEILYLYYIWDASSARLHFWLQKNHLPKCELERGGGG